MENPATPEKRILLVTVATVGCGKTTLGAALRTLYGGAIGHIQNDEIPSGKQKKQIFVTGTKRLLEQHPLVLMDRNNAEKRERKQIFTDLVIPELDISFVALNFLPHGPNARSRKRTRELALSRGDAHLMLHSLPESQLLKIIGDFEKRFEPVDTTKEPDSRFNLVINLRPGETLHNLKTTIKALSRLDAARRFQFTEEEIVAAYQAALNYDPRA